LQLGTNSFIKRILAFIPVLEIANIDKKKFQNVDTSSENKLKSKLNGKLM